MNNLKRKLFFVSLLVVPLAVFAIYMIIYLGGFKEVQIQIQNKGPYTMIYKDHFGAYYKIVPTIEEVEAWVKSQQIDCTQSFGEYLDNPKQVEDDRQRSHGGCIVSRVPSVMPKDFKTQIIPEKKYITAVFEGSPGIGPMKVYPKVYAYAQDHKLTLAQTVIEIYVIHSEKEMTTTYLFPLN